MTGGPLLAVRLPMYDWPEIRAHTRALEAALQDAIVGALDLDAEKIMPWPDRTDLTTAWLQPDLLLSQTCGFPLVHALKGRVRLLGSPIYAAPGCDGPYYCSHLIVRRHSGFNNLKELRGKRAVFNGPDSQSGMNAFRRSVADEAGGRAFFSKVTCSGSHLKSMSLVAENQADVASIDAVCWHLACRELPELSIRLRPIARTELAPGLPLVTSLNFSPRESALIAGAVADVLTSSETAKSRERLGIRGFSELSDEDYLKIEQMRLEALALGYPVLQ